MIFLLLSELCDCPGVDQREAPEPSNRFPRNPAGISLITSSSPCFERRTNYVNDDSMMIPKRETLEAVEERGTGSTKYPRYSNSATGKRKVIVILILVLFALMLITSQFYTDKMIWGPRLWEVFWAYLILIGVWLIVTILQVLRKGP
jgi:hypothetical protein